MGLITLSQISNGDDFDATPVDNNFDSIANEFNGNIENANIKTGANIDGAKLLNDSIPASKVKGEEWTSHTPTITGFSSVGQINKYTQIGKTAFYLVGISGASNATTFTFTLPFIPKNSQDIGPCRIQDNGTLGFNGLVSLIAGSNVATVTTSAGGAAFSATGSKALTATLIYEAQ